MNPGRFNAVAKYNKLQVQFSSVAGSVVKLLVGVVALSVRMSLGVVPVAVFLVVAP